MIEYLGYVAGTLTVLSFLPQVVSQLADAAHPGDLSMGMFALLITVKLALDAVRLAQIASWPVVVHERRKDSH